MESKETSNKLEDNNNNQQQSSIKREDQGTTSEEATLTSETVVQESVPPSCTLQTISFRDFVSLLSPTNVEHCLTCSNSLLANGPLPVLPQKRSTLLKSFCDILNLPFNPPPPPPGEDQVTKDEDNNEDAEDEESEYKEESGINFPFCFHCANKKVLLLSMVHEKLKILQAQFDQLKETIMKDVVRGFVSNVVIEKKIPVQVIRESKLCERMFHYFKRHSDRRVKKDTMDSEVQTDITSLFTPLLNPSAVASLLENSSASTPHNKNNNRRRKPVIRKSESILSNSKSWNNYGSSKHSKSSNLNSHAHLDYKLSPLKPSTPGTYYDDSSDSPTKNTQTVIEESIVPFDEHLNGGGMFPFDDNGILNMGGENDTYMCAADIYSSSFKANYVQHPTMNGCSSIDDEFRNVLGLNDGYERETSIRVESVVAPKTSPLIYTDLDSVDMGNKMNVQTVHGGDKPFKCRGCDRQFSRRDHFNSHEGRHVVNSKRIFFCHRCVDKNKFITSKSSYVSHCVEVHGIEDDVVEFFYFCDNDDCSESFKIREDFINHIKSHWKLAESNNCATCDKIFADKKRLIAHETEAHKRNSVYYDCQFCYKGFEEESDFSHHLLFHKVKMPEVLDYSCEQCGKCFETLSRLRRHIYLSHVHVRSKFGKSKTKPDGPVDVQRISDSVIQNDDNDDESIAEPDFQCEECGKIYSTEKKLTNHVQKHHSGDKSQRKIESPSSEDDVPDAGQVDADPEDEDYQGPGSNKRKRRRKTSGKTTRTSNHSTNSNFKKACEFCPQKYKTAVDLRRHLVNSHRKQHLQPGQVHCIVCFYVFDSQQELTDHCDEKHSKYKCHICDKQLQSTTVLRQHMERHKAQPFVCKLCNHGFQSKNGLRKHNTIAHRQRKGDEDDDDGDEESNTFSPANSLHDQNSVDLDSVDLFKI